MKRPRKKKRPFLDLEEEKVESEPTLKDVILIVSHTCSYALHCPHLDIKVNVTKKLYFVLE